MAYGILNQRKTMCVHKGCGDRSKEMAAKEQAGMKKSQQGTLWIRAALRTRWEVILPRETLPLKAFFAKAETTSS